MFTCRIHIPENISRIITNIFKERLHVTGYNWKMVPHDIKDFYWQEFQVRIGSMIYFILFYFSIY